jgi:hypothetical protein
METNNIGKTFELNVELNEEDREFNNYCCKQVKYGKDDDIYSSNSSLLSEIGYPSISKQ